MLSVASCLFLFLLLSPTICIANSENEAATKIREAEDAVNTAYGAVLEAEKAGANITSLLSNLTQAAELLSKAKLIFNTNESAAVDFAVQSQAKLNGFLAKADVLKAAAGQQRDWDFMVNFVGPIVGTVIIIYGGVFAWFFLKRKYEKASSVT